MLHAENIRHATPRGHLLREALVRVTLLLLAEGLRGGWEHRVDEVRAAAAVDRKQFLPVVVVGQGVVQRAVVGDFVSPVAVGESCVYEEGVAAVWRPRHEVPRAAVALRCRPGLIHPSWWWN